jgi:thiol-disulfide isomerase/thioredoxin
MSFRRAWVMTASLILLATPFVPAATDEPLQSSSQRPRASRGGAPDFPPGTFSDGGHYSLDDFKGKAVVLFFYEKECPRCRGLIPERNKVVEQFKDQPVRFIAIGPNDSMSDVVGYMRGTHLEMTSFPDTLGVMEARYGFHISLQNIYQFRYIGPEGNIVDSGIDFTAEKVNQLLSKVKWKYRDGGFDPKLSVPIEMLEWNQYETGLQALRPFLKRKATAESAGKLYEAVKTEGRQWLDEASSSQSSDPGRSYDLYTKVAACFPGDEIGNTAVEALKTLKKDKGVIDELAARQQYAALYPAMSRAGTAQRAQVHAFCLQISSKYPQTATGKKAAALAKDLEAATAQATAN